MELLEGSTYSEYIVSLKSLNHSVSLVIPSPFYTRGRRNRPTIADGQQDLNLEQSTSTAPHRNPRQGP